MEKTVFIDSFDELVHELSVHHAPPFLIAIDGRPCSGKTTLAGRLAKALCAQVIYLDEFFIPQKEWPKHPKPTFPFFYLRYDEFIEGVRKLSAGKSFSYCRYNWDTHTIATQPTIVKPDTTIIVEGVSTLYKELINFYAKKIWVDSDQRTEPEAIRKRQNYKNLDLWMNFYIPSVNLYFEQKPWQYANIMYAGRGLQEKHPFGTNGA